MRSNTRIVKKKDCKKCASNIQLVRETEQNMKDIKVEYAQKLARCRKDFIQQRNEIEKLNRLILRQESKYAELETKYQYLQEKAEVQTDQIAEYEKDVQQFANENDLFVNQ